MGDTMRFSDFPRIWLCVCLALLSCGADPPPISTAASATREVIDCPPPPECPPLVKCGEEEIRVSLKQTTSDLSECREVVAGLKQAAEELGQENELLRNAAPERLRRAIEAKGAGQEASALTMLQELVTVYPTSPEARSAESVIVEIEQERERRTEEERKQAFERARLEREQARAIRTERSASVGPTEIKIDSAKFAEKWVFDRMSYEYMYSKATRGNRYLVVDHTVESTSPNPKLAPLYAYAWRDGALRLIGRLGVEFYKWSDYGSYLGNYTDFKNSFAHSKRIRFTAGVSVPVDQTKEPIFVGVGKESCVARTQEKYGRPAVKYAAEGCRPEPTLSPSNYSDHMVFLKVFNKSRL